MKLIFTLFVFVLFVFVDTGNAQNFWKATSGPNAGTVYTLTANSAGKIFAGTANSGVYRSTVNDSTWVKTGLTTKDVEALVVDSGGRIFAACGGVLFGALYLSTDNGDSWTKLCASTVGYVSLAINPDGHIFIGSSKDSVFRSTDHGNTWQRYKLGVTTPVTGFAASSGGVIYACSGKNIFKSTDNGQTWASVYTSQTYDVRSICIHPNGHLFANTAGVGVIRSKDNGATWGSSSNGLPITGGWPIVTDSHGDLFVATGIAGGYGGGVFLSTDLGENWVSISSGLPIIWIQSMAIASNGVLYGGGSDGKVYRSTNTVVGVKDIPARIISDFALYQNYPNPFNPVTTINYSVAKPGLVTIIVYDVLGREVETLLNKEKSAGSYFLKFDGSGLTSGIYFYRMRAGDFVETKKLILLK